MLLVIMATMFSVDVFAYRPRYHGNCGENVRYSFNEDTGELEIFGEGDIDDYNVEDKRCSPPWYEYKSRIRSVEIEKGVTGIGSDAFCGCSLTSITIPDSITYIE